MAQPPQHLPPPGRARWRLAAKGGRRWCVGRHRSQAVTASSTGAETSRRARWDTAGSRAGEKGSSARTTLSPGARSRSLTSTDAMSTPGAVKPLVRRPHCSPPDGSRCRSPRARPGCAASTGRSPAPPRRGCEPSCTAPRDHGPGRSERTARARVSSSSFPGAPIDRVSSPDERPRRSQDASATTCSRPPRSWPWSPRSPTEPGA